MSGNGSSERLWAEFLASGSPPAAQAQERGYSAWAFGSSAEMADDLLALVLAGGKRATAGSLWVYERDGEPVPVPGDFSVVLDGAGEARCIVMTTAAEVVPFDRVGAEFAAAEGEGDLTLAYWREGHRRYFERELAAFGRTFAEDMPVVCERFTVVYPREAADAR